MTATMTHLEQSRHLALRDQDTLQAQVEQALSRANSNASRNVYLAADREWTLRQSTELAATKGKTAASRPLYGTAVSLKDCFDLKGFSTTCGSRAYAAEHANAGRDSWVVERLRTQGAIVTGKTHLHQLAYGITGENAEFGDCLQPRDAERLTGGSSSGAAASVQEGSAIAAIGTDTGGSIRVPAALCGLAGYRSSLGLGDWRGGAHLAPSFDTIGWLFRDLRDAPLLAHALFDLPVSVFRQPDATSLRIGLVDAVFLHDSDASVLVAFADFEQTLRALGAHVQEIDTSTWGDSFEIFSAIQASEAAAIHTEPFDRFEPAIAERLRHGASIDTNQLTAFRERHQRFRKNYDQLFERYDFLVMPCAPVSVLPSGDDHSAARKRILRYTTPASLAGSPVVAVPLKEAGVQIIGRHGADSSLVAFAAWLGGRISPGPGGIAAFKPHKAQNPTAGTDSGLG